MRVSDFLVPRVHQHHFTLEIQLSKAGLEHTTSIFIILPDPQTTQSAAIKAEVTAEDGDLTLKQECVNLVPYFRIGQSFTRVVMGSEQNVQEVKVPFAGGSGPVFIRARLKQRETSWSKKMIGVLDISHIQWLQALSQEDNGQWEG